MIRATTPAILLGLLGLAPITAAQTLPSPVDQSIADISSLATSLRLIPRDLRQPLNFEQVFETKSAEGEDRFVRISGGLYAVFARSIYVPTREGTVPVIANDTVFHIGEPPSPEPDPAPLRTYDGRLDLRLDTRISSRVANQLGDTFISRPYEVADPAARPASELPDKPAPRIISDARYRSQRLHELLHRAANAYAEERTWGNVEH